MLAEYSWWKSVHISVCFFFYLNISHWIVIYWKCDRYHVPIKLQNNQKKKSFWIQTIELHRSFNVKMYRLCDILSDAVTVKNFHWMRFHIRACVRIIFPIPMPQSGWILPGEKKKDEGRMQFDAFAVAHDISNNKQLLYNVYLFHAIRYER